MWRSKVLLPPGAFSKPHFGTLVHSLPQTAEQSESTRRIASRSDLEARGNLLCFGPKYFHGYWVEAIVAAASAAANNPVQSDGRCLRK
jgi:hypothetical protein